MDGLKTTRFTRKRLPHWEVEGDRYFFTIHRAGAIPNKASDAIRRMSAELGRLRGGEMLEHRRQISREMEAWLDRAEGARDFVVPRVAEMLVETIKNRYERRGWDVFQYVIMPSHAHLFFSVGENGTGMIRTITEFKRWTGRQAGKWIELRSGDFWEREWFGHWSRSPGEDFKIIDYRVPLEIHTVGV